MIFLHYQTGYYLECKYGYSTPLQHRYSITSTKNNTLILSQMEHLNKTLLTKEPTGLVATNRHVQVHFQQQSTATIALKHIHYTQRNKGQSDTEREWGKKSEIIDGERQKHKQKSS